MQQMKSDSKDRRFTYQDMSEMGKALAISVLDVSVAHNTESATIKSAGGLDAMRTWAIEKVKVMYSKHRIPIQDYEIRHLISQPCKTK